MDILFISHEMYPCKIGGIEIFNYYLIKTLTKFYKIFIITCCNKKIDLDIIPIRIEPRKFLLSRISIPIQDFVNIAKLRNKVDLVFLPYMHTSWTHWLPYPILKKIFNIPYIVSIHGGGMHTWKPKFPHKFLFKNASAIIGVSAKIKEEYEKRTGREINLVPPLIPFKKCEGEKEKLRSKYNLKREDKIIICLGSIRKIKGSDILLSAFFKLGKEYIKYHKLKLIFVGDGDMRKNLEAKAELEDFNEFVRFFGGIPHEEVPAMFKVADIYIIPSLFEGTPISLLEAMFNEMPIIGADTNGINNIITDKKNGLLFKVNDSEDLKNKIIFLVEDKYFERKIANKAKKGYEDDYNFKVVVKKHTELFERTK